MNAERFVRTCIPEARTIAMRRSHYATSHRIDEVDVRCIDGSERQLILKRSGAHDLLPEARGARPAFLVDPAREADVYRSILAAAGLGTARFYGSRDDHRGGHWLLIERVRGAQLCHVGDRGLWQETGRWLARMHLAFEPFADGRATNRLIRHDEGFYRRWPARAIAFHPSQARPIEWLARRWDELVERLVALPRTVIHGEFYPSNALVDGHTGRVCAIDWEMAAVGPAIVDLAALTSGWSGDDLDAIVDAYRTELSRHRRAIAHDDLAASLVDCRMYLCMQWLGWAHGWVPPDDQVSDWLGEALSLTDASGW